MARTAHNPGDHLSLPVGWRAIRPPRRVHRRTIGRGLAVRTTECLSTLRVASGGSSALRGLLGGRYLLEWQKLHWLLLRRRKVRKPRRSDAERRQVRSHGHRATYNIHYLQRGA